MLDELVDKEDPENADEEAYDARQRKIRNEEEDSCGICLVPFEEAEELVALSCPATSPVKKSSKADGDKEDPDELQADKKHLFHKECIVPWF